MASEDISRLPAVTYLHWLYPVGKVLTYSHEGYVCFKKNTNLRKSEAVQLTDVLL